MDTWASGGVTVRLSDGTNFSEWYVSGSDRASGAWDRICFSAGSTPDAVSGTLSLAAVTVITFYFTGVTKSKLPENVFIDFLQYGADGDGITVTGGTSGTPEALADVVGDNAVEGILDESDGVYLLNGAIEFGDSAGTGDMYFQDSDQLIASKSHYRSFTTANRGTAESLVSASHYSVDVVGNATGTTSFVLGNKSGSLGYSGCTLKTGGNRKIILTCTDTDADIFKLYGSTFINLGAISFPTYVVDDREVISSSFAGCLQIDPSTCTFNNCVISGSADSATGAMLLDASGSANMSALTFISGGTGHAVYIPNGATGTYGFTDFAFAGYGATTTTDAMVYNDSAGAVTIEQNGTTPSVTYRNGTSATTTVTASYILTMTDLVDGSQVTIVNSSTRTELQNSAVTGTGIVTYTHAGGETVDILVMDLDYDPNVSSIYDLLLPSTNSSIKFDQQADINYI